MGCGASSEKKVSPSIKVGPNDAQPKERPASSNSAKFDVNLNKPHSLENVRSSFGKEKLLTKRPSSHSGSIRSTESPKHKSSKKLVRDSKGSVRPQSATSTCSELERKFSGSISKKESVEKLFQASSSEKKRDSPLLTSSNGGSLTNAKPFAFEVPLDTKPPKMRPPRRLETLKNAPKLLTQQELQEKLKLSEERRELEIQRRRLKSSQMSRRKRELLAAKEQSRMQEQAEEIKGKMDSTSMNRERLQAEKADKQRRRLEHAEKVRERARKMKQKQELDEGLGGEMETFKADSDDEANVNRWSAKDDEDQHLDKSGTSASIDSRASLDTVDSGIPKAAVESTDQFYNA